MNTEERKAARIEAHLNFMKQCFEEADNILAQSQSAAEYDEKHAEGFRNGYWMAKWTALGDFGINFGFPRDNEYVEKLPQVPRSVID